MTATPVANWPGDRLSERFSSSRCRASPSREAPLKGCLAPRSVCSIVLLRAGLAGQRVREAAQLRKGGFGLFDMRIMACPRYYRELRAGDPLGISTAIMRFDKAVILTPDDVGRPPHAEQLAVQGAIVEERL